MVHIVPRDLVKFILERVYSRLAVIMNKLERKEQERTGSKCSGLEGRLNYRTEEP
jgi:hypothetical protein